MSSYAAAAGGAGWRSPFTASQWQELEHQALIFKYLVAGVPVPSELLLPILKSFESMAARFYHHPTMGYCSLYGKKLDPEPWRCRRTDGKKWRCSKNAYPDSKYCERHMHRGRNRSRKPVETPSLSQSQPPTSSPSSTVTTLSPSGGAGMGGAAAAAKSLPSGIPLQSLGCSGGGNSAAQVSLTGSSGLGQLQIGPGYYQMAGGDNRYLLGVKSEDQVDERKFLSEASGSARGLGIEASLDNPWQLMPSQVSSYCLSKPRDVSDLPNGGSPPGLQSMQDFDHEANSSVSARQQQKQHCFFGGEFDSRAPLKQDGQPLLSFFDEWPNTRDSWSDLEDDRSNRTSLSTTQLSISIPVASSDFSTTSSRSSPNGED